MFYETNQSMTSTLKKKSTVTHIQKFETPNLTITRIIVLLERSNLQFPGQGETIYFTDNIDSIRPIFLRL